MSKLKALLKDLEERDKDLKAIKEKSQSIKEHEKALEKELKENDPPKRKINLTEKFPLSITAKIIEKTVDEQRRTVIAGVLQEDTLSTNNRFYPGKVVRKAIKTLEGKRSLVGHDTDDVTDVVAKIERSFMKNGVGFAEFKFGTDARSEMILSKIKEGLIDSTSIRASGVMVRGKVNGEFVDVVEELNIASVDWVVEGGVDAAKVVQVFEKAPSIILETQEDKKNMDDLKKLQEEMDALKKQHTELMKSNEEKDSKVVELETKVSEGALESHRQSKLATIKDDKVRGLIAGQLKGSTTDEIDKAFDSNTKFYESLRKEAGIKTPFIAPVDGNKGDEKFKDVYEVFSSSSVPRQEKINALKELIP